MGQGITLNPHISLLYTYSITISISNQIEKTPITKPLFQQQYCSQGNHLICPQIVTGSPVLVHKVMGNLRTVRRKHRTILDYQEKIRAACVIFGQANPDHWDLISILGQPQHYYGNETLSTNCYKIPKQHIYKKQGFSNKMHIFFSNAFLVYVVRTRSCMLVMIEKVFLNFIYKLDLVQSYSFISHFIVESKRLKRKVISLVFRSYFRESSAFSFSTLKGQAKTLRR